MEATNEPRHQSNPAPVGEVLVALIYFGAARTAYRYLRDNGLSQAPDWVILGLLVLGGIALVALVSFLMGWGLHRGRRAAGGN